MEQLLEHSAKFRPEEINEDWRQVALSYLNSYEGDFPFMLDMKSRTSWTNSQLAGILNCAKHEAKKVIKMTSIPELKDIPTTDPTSLDEVLERIQILEENLNLLKNSQLVERAKEVLNSASQREQELFAEFQKKIETLRTERNAAESVINKFQHEVHDTETELEFLKRKQVEFIKAQAAMEKLEELKVSLEELASTFSWREKLRPYQWDDICHTSAAFQAGRSGVLNANDMGLGKTLETIAQLDLLDHLFYKEVGRLPVVLWLTKKSLVGNTFNEVRKWSTRRCIKLSKIPDRKQRELIVSMGITNHATIITNYDAINSTPLIKNTKWDIVVMDEVHKVKGGANSTPTQIFTNTKEVCKNARFILPLTGSPIVNHPKEMWCYLNIFDEHKFPSVRQFEREFCFGYGEVDEDGKPLIQVNWDKLIMNALKDRVIRRSKSEVLKDLPDKEREFRYLEMEGDQLAHYESLRTNFFTWLDGEQTKPLSATSILAQLTRLRQCAIYPGGIKVKDEDTGGINMLSCSESVKLDEAMDIIEELTRMNEQVVVFSSQFNEPLFELERRIVSTLGVSTAILTGSNSADLEKFQTDFQQGKTRVLLINMKTGSEGLNLQKSSAWPGGASHCIFLDLWYNPAQNLQAEDRLHRIGQTDSVTIYILQCENSVDQFIAEILERKEEMISGIMERDELRTGHDWKSLLESLI